MYRLKVRDAMSYPVIVAAPGDSLREVQYLLRDNGITGVPIVEGGRLVGLVSMGLVFEALDSGRIEEKAGALMTKSVVSLEDDMPLSFAVTYFNRYKYGRFPVLNRDGLVVGIISASDIVRRLLVELNAEVAKLEERLSKNAGEGVASAEGEVRLSFPVTRYDFENAGKASTQIKKALVGLGLEPAVIRRAAVACYELELNQSIHSDGGTLSCVASGGRIEILAVDRGPGIADVEAAMTEGFSTANEWIRSLGFGAGMGLPNAKRVSDDFSIESSLGRGTTVKAIILY